MMKLMEKQRQNVVNIEMGEREIRDGEIVREEQGEVERTKTMGKV